MILASSTLQSNWKGRKFEDIEEVQKKHDVSAEAFP